MKTRSPSSRGRGLKYVEQILKRAKKVALFTRAWIEIERTAHGKILQAVALFTRAWIEIQRHGII